MTDAHDSTTASQREDQPDDPAETEGESVSGTAEDGGTTAQAAETAPSRPESTETVEASAPEIDTSSDEVLMRASPLLKPLLGVIGTVVLVTAVIAGVIVTNPQAFGDVGLATIALNAVVLLAGIVLIRLGVKVLVLRRTTYTIRADGFETSYSLAYKHYERTIPVSQLRGQEIDRGRYQTLFGCATVSLLTGGTNRSIGFVEFEYVPNPDEVREQVRQVRKAYEAQN